MIAGDIIRFIITLSDNFKLEYILVSFLDLCWCITNSANILVMVNLIKLWFQVTKCEVLIISWNFLYGEKTEWFSLSWPSS